MTRRPRTDRLLDEAIELAILLAEAPGDPELARMVDAFSARSQSHRDAWARVRSLPTSRALTFRPTPFFIFSSGHR